MIDTMHASILSIVHQPFNQSTNQYKCTAYLVLHAWAKSRRTFQCNKYWSTTDFLLCDLWNVDLSNADVVAVYGLHPIMGKLGKKMEKELKHGCIVGECNVVSCFSSTLIVLALSSLSFLL
jgi:hypothetical protein